MPMKEELEQVARKTKVCFFVVDPELVRHWPNGPEGFTDAMNLIVPTLREYLNAAADIDFRIAVLEAGQNPRWQNPAGPVPYDEFRCDNFWSQPSDLNCALGELAVKMHHKAFMQTKVGSWRPAVFFLLYGETSEEQLPGLKKLWENKWFQHAAKIVLMLNGKDDCTGTEWLTGMPETVIRAETPEAFVQWLTTMVVRVSIEIQSGLYQSMYCGKNPWNRPEDSIELLYVADEEETILWTDCEGDFD